VKKIISAVLVFFLSRNLTVGFSPLEESVENSLTNPRKAV